MKAVLLIPAPEHRDALLGEGVCGSRPPTARYMPSFTEMERNPNGSGWAWIPCRSPLPGFREALVLAWDGAAVDAGCDRAARAAGWEGGPLYRWTLGDAIALAHACAARSLGTVEVIP